MAGGDPVLVLFFAAAVGVAIGLGYRVHQLEEMAGMLRSACVGKDDTIRALARENTILKDLFVQDVVENVSLWPRHENITTGPRSDNTLH